MKKLLGVDIDSIIKQVLRETFPRDEKIAQQKKSSQVKDFKAPPNKKKGDVDVDEVEDDLPSEKETQEKKDVKAEDIIGLLNQMRSGKSLNDKDTRTDFQGYFNSLDGAERLALYAYVVALTDIISGPSDDAVSGDEPSPEKTYGIEMDIKKPKMKKKKVKQSEKEEEDSAPIVVGEAANKSKELNILRGLK